MNNVIEIVTNMANPFDVQDDGMINIASGTLATDDVCKDMLAAKQVGESKCKKFINESLLADECDIFSTIPSTKLKTFSIMTKKNNVKTSKGQIVELKNDVKFVSRLLAIGSSRNIDMKDVLSYSLRKFPSPFATTNGMLVKTPKSKFMHLIEERTDDPFTEQLPVNNALMIDAMALLQTLKSIPGTFGELAELIVKKLLASAQSSNSTRVDFVCDRYPEVSIKGLERSKRAEAGGTVVKILGPNQKVPKQYNKFLSVGKNKEALIEFIFQHMRNITNLHEILKDVLVMITHGNLCHKITKNAQGEVEIEGCQELSCDHEEADTRLLLHSKHAAAADFENVVIRSPDTDVFILLLGHNQAIQSNLYFDTGSGNQRRIIDVSAVHSSLGLALCDALIAFHAFTGEKWKSIHIGKCRMAFNVCIYWPINQAVPFL